jgi:hypothetical protein
MTSAVQGRKINKARMEIVAAVVGLEGLISFGELSKRQQEVIGSFVDKIGAAVELLDKDTLG